METKLKIFTSPKFGEVRTAFGEDGQILFCLSDVCKSLFIRVDNAMNRIDDPFTIGIIDSLGRLQKANFINEPNLYRLIFQSRKEEARQFQDWVFEEVLPSIRKTGGYSLEKVKQLESENQDLRDKLVQIEKRLTNCKHDGHLTSTTKLAETYGIEVEDLIYQLDREDFIIYFAHMMVITPMSEREQYAEYVTWYKGNRKIEYVGWTDKGVCAIVQALNLIKPNEIQTKSK